MKEVQDRVWAIVKRLREEGKLPDWSDEDFEDEPSALANSQYRLQNDPAGFLGPHHPHHLVGKTFMYNGPYGLHEWTDKVSQVTMHKEMHSEPGKLFSVMGYKVEWYVRASRTNYIYPIKDVIFLD